MRGIFNIDEVLENQKYICYDCPAKLNKKDLGYTIFWSGIINLECDYGIEMVVRCKACDEKAIEDVSNY